jgi:DNA (cytosine-5)-methyltransferase 1
MRYLSVCSGIEAATVAWHPLGWEPVAFSEIERFPSAVLANHHPTVPNLGDMNEHATWKIPATDLLVGGTPCQSFSVAGLRQGLADPRGGLMLRFLEIAQRHRPRWVVWENVPGVLSSNGGRDFGTLLGGLGELGYGWAYRVLDAQFFGVAQRRRRVFVVGCLGGQRRAGSVLFESESVCGHPAKGRQAGKDIAHDAGHGTGGSGIACTQFGPHAGTLTAPYDSSPCADRGQNVVAFPSRLSSTQAQETMRANISPALTRLNPMAVADSRAVGTWWDGKQTCQTIDAVVAKGQMMPEKNRFPVVAVGEKSCLPANATTTAIAQDAGSTSRSADVLGQLKKSNMSTAKTDTESSGRVVLRRLTPRECERLQGFPDDYTLIPYRRKAAGECPDGPRYKALGNSMAVPCMRWIGERIAAAN